MFLRWVRNQLELAYNWTAMRFEQAVSWFAVFAAVTLVLFVLSILVRLLGGDSDGAKGLFLVLNVLALLFAVLTSLTISAIAAAGEGVNRIIGVAVYELSRPLPSSPVQLPLLINSRERAELARSINLAIVIAILVNTFSVYFTVEDHRSLYLTFIIVSLIVGYIVAAIIRTRTDITKYVLGASLVWMVLLMVVLTLPGTMGRMVSPFSSAEGVSVIEDKYNKQRIAVLQQRLEMLYQERNGLMDDPSRSAQLTTVNQQIEKVKQEIASLSSYSSSGGWGSWPVVIAIALLLAFIVYALLRKRGGISTPWIVKAVVAAGLVVAVVWAILAINRATSTAAAPYVPPPITSGSTPSSAPTKVNTPSGQHFVDARNSAGIDTGIDVVSGQTLTIQATGTAVWKNIAVGNPTKYEESGPEGTSPTASPLMTAAEYNSNRGDYLCPQALKGALIGRIGNGSWFPVGNNFKGVMMTSGRLILGYNDLDPSKGGAQSWNDNDKGFYATISVR